MATDVKWIKLAVDIFDNRKIRQIESMPDGDSMIVIWLKLLILAGNVNDGGLVYFTKDIPYTEQLLATQFNRPIATVQLALRTFQQFGMISIIDDLIMVTNWEKYQNLDVLNKVREQNRLRKAKQRDREKLLLTEKASLSRDGHVTVTECHATEEEKEEEKDKEEEKEVAVEESGDGDHKSSETDLDPDEARKILMEQNEILNAAEQAGFNNNEATRAKLIDMYTEFGKDRVLEGIDICVNRGKISPGYLRGCLTRDENRKAGKLSYEGY